MLFKEIPHSFLSLKSTRAVIYQMYIILNEVWILYLYLFSGWKDVSCTVITIVIVSIFSDTPPMHSFDRFMYRLKYRKSFSVSVSTNHRLVPEADHVSRLISLKSCIIFLCMMQRHNHIWKDISPESFPSFVCRKAGTLKIDNRWRCETFLGLIVSLPSFRYILIRGVND